jgi:arylsulfatase A-like enzyme
MFFWGVIGHAAAEKPNIIYVLADDLGYGDLSCYGQEKFETPQIDKMASEGMRFTDHYAGNTVCAPSRCTLMTGYHTGHAFVRGNREKNPIGQQPMPCDTVTIAKVLHDAGYATGMFGKWGLGAPGSASDPLKMGFDTFYGYNCQRNAHNHYPKFLFHDEKKVPLDGKTYSHDLIFGKALEFIRANRETPFFCYLPVIIPHASMHCPEEYVAPFRKKFPQFENTYGRYAGPKVKNPIAAFAGMMTKLDEDIGRLLDLLRELGIERNTIVIFTSDNGPHREGGHQPDFWNSNGPLKGIKRDLTEGGIRVPLIAWGPGTIPEGTISDLPSAFWDFMPTACDFAGVTAPERIDGVSFFSTLTGHSGEQKQHTYLYWEFKNARAVRMGNWKCVQWQVDRQPDSPVSLYDLSNDIGETQNIADENPEVVAAMRQIFSEAHTPSVEFPLLAGEGKGKK